MGGEHDTPPEELSGEPDAARARRPQIVSMSLLASALGVLFLAQAAPLPGDTQSPDATESRVDEELNDLRESVEQLRTDLDEVANEQGRLRAIHGIVRAEHDYAVLRERQTRDIIGNHAHADVYGRHGHRALLSDRDTRD